MKRAIFTILIFLLPIGLSAQWVNRVGASSNDVAYSTAIDTDGNMYITGYYIGSVDFDPSSGFHNASGFGGTDIYIAKYSPTGSLIWVNNIGGSGSDVGRGITIDANGNVCVIGSFSETVDFDPSETHNLTSVGSTDIFLAKYDTDGGFIWANSFGSSTDDLGFSIAVDASENIYVTGYFRETVDFDPHIGVNNLSSAGFWDIFFGKYDSDGELVWVKNIGGTSSDVGNGITIDGSGNVYLTGYFRETVDFDPGGGTNNLTSVGDTDVFFAKYASDGSYAWANSIGGLSGDIGNSIAIDGAGNSYIIGYFQGTADFDPSGGTYNLVSLGGADVYFAKYNSSGGLIWANNIGSNSDDVGYSIIATGSSDIFITGFFNNTADFDPGAGSDVLTSAGNIDVFYAKYTSSGSLIWAKNIGGTSLDIGRDIAISSGGNLYIAGYFDGQADFDPDAGIHNLISYGGHDIFFAKYLSDGVLPVELTTFAANVTSKSVKLIWETATEVNNYGFELERQFVTQIANNLTNEKWDKIAFIEGHGNSNSPKHYSFSDNSVNSGKYNYRLKQIDIDGSYEYSDVVEVDLGLPSEFKLLQNYPNPFNPTTTIKYTVPSVVNENFHSLQLKIYDILGKEVTTLVNEQHSAGNYKVEFDASSLNSGIYFYTIRSGKFFETKKMLLMK